MEKTSSIVEPIIYTAMRLEGIANRFVFQPMGVSLSSVKILRILCCNREMTQQDILKLIGGTKSNISQRLDFLEKKKYIRRDYTKYKSDRRKVAVALTALGKAKLKEVDKRLRRSKLTLEQQFSPAEIEAHCKFFKKIHQIIDSKERDLPEIFSS